MASKMSVATLRKIKKELEERAQRVRYDERFDSSAVEKAITKKFAKEWEAIVKMPAGQIVTLQFCSSYGMQSQRRGRELLPPSVRATLKKMQAAYELAKKTFEEASSYAKFTNLAAKIGSLEVEVLIGGLETDDPKILALLEEVRVALS